MISIIITAYEEPKTIGKAIEAVLENKIKESYEILVTAPDKETLEAAKFYSKKNNKIRIIKDEGEGKPTALNLAVKKAKGDILVLSDGDVYIGNNSLWYLLDKFKDKNIGAVSGHPVSLNPKTNMLGFWSCILTKIANERRLKAVKLKKRFFCSGYLFAIKKSIFPKLSPNLLSEDGFISHSVYEAGYKIAYSPESKVYIKYPLNFSDWIKQKRRSTGGYNQIKKLIGAEIRSFKKESFGAFDLFKFVSNSKEFLWLILLYFARIYLWFVIYKDINLKRKSHKEIWLRIKSTK